MATITDNEIKAVEPVNLVKADLPSEPIEPIETVKPARAVKPAKAAKPVEAVAVVPAIEVVKPEKTTVKRSSKSKRAHIRKMKAAARIAGTVYRPGLE